MKYIPSPLASEFRGTAGSITASRGRGGTYLKRKSTPVQPDTSIQTERRFRFGQSSNTWNAITQAARDTWNAATVYHPRTNSLGQTYYMSGQNLFVANSTTRRLLGESFATNAPPLDLFPFFAPGQPVYVVEASDTALDRVLTVTGGSAGNDPDAEFLIYATAPLPPGRNYVSKSAFKFIGFYAATTITANDLLAAYEAIYGALNADVVGQAIHFEFIGCSPNRWLSSPIRTKVIAVAG